MTDWAKDYCRAQLGIRSRDESPLPDRDWGLYHADDLDYLLRAYGEYREHGVYPNGKGLDFQPLTLINDFELITRLISLWMPEIAKERSGS